MPCPTEVLRADLLHERARAKINLTLRVLGRRPSDGYHLLDSIVAFADTADDLLLDLAAAPGIEMTGPFGDRVEGANIVAAAVEMALAIEPRLQSGRIILRKNLPVAAGIGGGSADAAATLRLLRRANPDLAERVPWYAIAARLGADVTVCLANNPARIEGIGDRITAISGLPPLAAVLVNLGGPVLARKTAEVFRALTAPVFAEDWESAAMNVLAARGQLSVAAAIESLAREGNDLDAPARALMPDIAEVQQALAACPGSRLVRLSGAGPTCFALFDDDGSAADAARTLSNAHPTWWVQPTTIR